MEVKNFFRNTFLVLPAVVLTACSSTKTTNTNDADVLNEASTSNVLNVQNYSELKNVYFDFDKFNIKPDFAEVLDSHAEFLRSNPNLNVTIEGHADERGTPEYNIALGEKRANAVKVYLQGRGIDVSRIEIVSYGKEKPLIIGHDETAYEKNRRAVILY